MTISSRTKVKPPLSLSATSTVISGVVHIDISWTPVASAWPVSYYVVYRDGAEIATNQTGTTYRDSAALAGSHFYEVSTVNVNEFESQATATTPAYVATAPIWESGWSLSIDQNTTDSVAARCRDIDDLSLTFSKQGGSAPSTVTVGGTGTVTVGATAGGSYTLIIRASNGVLTSDTTVNLAVNAALVAPGDPINFNADGITSSVISLSWAAGSGPTPTKYQVDRSLTGAAPWVSRVDSLVTSLIDTSLSANTAYFYRCRAFNQSLTSNYVTATDSTLQNSGVADVVIAAGTGASTLNASSLGAGDIIEFAVGNHGPRKITNILGSAANPVIIRNASAGVAWIRNPATGGTSFPLEITDSKYFTLDGSLTSSGITKIPQRYSWMPAATRPVGIKVSSLGGDVNAYIKIRGTSSDYTVRGVEIQGIGIPGNAEIGFSPNDQTKLLPASQFVSGNPASWRENITIEDCWVHDVGKEGIYCGPDYNERNWPLRNITIQGNLVEDCGWSALDCKNWIGGTNAIRDNVCINNANAVVGIDQQKNSIDVLSGKATVERNWIIDGGGTGFKWSQFGGPPQVFGVMSGNVQNNVIVRCGQLSNADYRGIHVTTNTTDLDGPIARPVPTIRNNTIVNMTGKGIELDSLIVSGSVRDNIVVGSSGVAITSPNVTQTTNLTGAVSAAGFLGAASDDYHLAAGSAAINTATGPAPTVDFDSVTRANPADRGAYEKV